MRTWITSNTAVVEVEMEAPSTEAKYQLHEVVSRNMQVVEMLELLLLVRMALRWISTSECSLAIVHCGSTRGWRK